MKYIAGAYRSFRTADDDQAEQEVAVWHDILQDIPNQLAMEKTRELCRVNTQFPPTPAAIYQACQVQPRSFYELQRAEEEADRLALAEYNEKAVPMPDRIRVQLEQMLERKKVGRQ
ncbi:replicative helicase loader/inhibitor [Paenibacillus sp. FSL K6-1330]|uniref:replicative helicase loader/inhibitor n=1 Tax=Paenibacillus sp. FSL K6-1330 TaxID=2975292 RepID=UPI0030DC350D